jgi:UDP-2-acetamido-2,6-beta-L-arabino-hexul-4-ose reductase
MFKKEIVKRSSDARGFVFEPLGGELLASQKNTHVVVSRPGAVRGNHYHLRGTETLVVCGPSMIRIREENDIEDFFIPANTTCRLVIPPGVSHAIQNTGGIDSLLVAFNTEAHDPDKPDLVQDLLIPF